MSNINNLPYAKWLEESLQNVIKSDTDVICIISKSKNGEIGNGYWNCTVADKLLFAGFIQQDAMIDTLAVNGYLDEEDEFENEEEDVNG